MKRALTLGFSPYNAPSFHLIRPFDALFSEKINLEKATDEELSKCDAVLLWGGADISPSMYGEHPFLFSGPATPTDRDLFEWEILRRAKEKKIPMIGVCRGAQLMCAFAGGKLVQDVNGHNCGYHDIIIEENGKRTLFNVTSSHHQMMFPYDVNHELLGWSKKVLSNKYEPNYKLYCGQMDKGLFPEAEVVYFPQLKGLAMQCHPEWHGVDHPFNNWMLNYIQQTLLKSPSNENAESPETDRSC